jgi:hypothetical protein
MQLQIKSASWTENGRIAAILAIAAAGNRPLSVTLRLSSEVARPKVVIGVPTASSNPHMIWLRQPAGIFVAPIASVIALQECPQD